jgi:hypothetical protein
VENVINQRTVHTDGRRHILITGKFGFFADYDYGIRGLDSEFDAMGPNVQNFHINRVSDEEALAGPPPHH